MHCTQGQRGVGSVLGLSSIFLVVAVVFGRCVQSSMASPPWEEIQKLLASDGTGGDEFGSSVAISGNIGVIGAQFAGMDYAGSAYVFDVVTGEERFMVRGVDGVNGEQFGSAVAIDGNVVLVGSPNDDDNGLRSGSVYVFDASTGAQLMKLHASDGIEDDRFGSSVALCGNIAVIGTDNPDAHDVGLVYVFDVSSGQQLRMISIRAPCAIVFGGLSFSIFRRIDDDFRPIITKEDAGSG